TCRPARSRRRCPSDSVAFHTKRHGAHAGDVPRYHEQFHLVDDDGKTVLPHTRYEIESESGKRWSGYSDANGFTQHVYTDQPEALSLTVYKEVDDDSDEEA
ncbi:hypothetical protein, partial [Burkholderia vietnamiensis]|uniref:hypothetical protein n=1 Tax=Burkholderia vietnamiensis TaxID=60552 RepID=UPI0039BFD5B9